MRCGSRFALALVAACALGDVPDPGLAGQWDLQEAGGTVITDNSGNGDTGTVVNGPAWVKGVCGSAFQFTGDNYIDLGGAANLKPLNGLTISAWLQASAQNAYSPVVSFDSGSAATYELGWKDSGSSQSFGAYLSIWSGHTQYTAFSHLSNISAGAWYFLSGTYDSQSGTLTVSVNGAAQATASAPPGSSITYPAFGTQHVNLGAQGGAHNLRAAVEKVRLYNRPLAPSEVAALYAACAPTVAPAPPSASAPSATSPARSGNLTILYPPDHAVLPAAGFNQTYLAVETRTPSTCAYAAQDLTYAQMTPFTNTGNSLYHTNLVAPGAPGTFMYYIACQESAGGAITPSVSLSFSIGQTAAYVPANLRAVATSPTSVLLSWTDPSPGNSQRFQIYRDGAPSGATTATSYLDTNLTPDTLYHYSVADVVGNATRQATLRAPVRTLPNTVTATPAPPDALDDFEGALRVINPGESRPDMKYLWGQYPFSDLANVQLSDGIATPTDTTAESGRYSLEVTVSGYLPSAGSTYDGIPVLPGMFVEPGTAYLSFYPFTETTNLWSFTKEHLAAGAWQNDTYNRLRFWVKVPPGFTKFYSAANPGQSTMDFGSYVSSSHASHTGSGGAESGFGGNHYYHRFRLIPTGQWQQVIVDMHPHHQRGAAGSMEWGNMPYPTGESRINYFDSLTRFYLDFSHADPSTGKRIQFDSYPVTFYFDNFEFYKDTHPENDAQVFSISGTYDPSTNELEVSWAHPKNDGTTPHEVRYAFQNIYTLSGATPLDQWNQATPAPGGTVIPYDAAYNMMEYRTTAIPAAGLSTVYIAIKPRGAATFRQIAIPTAR